MTQTAQHDIALKARRLAQVAAELRQGQDFPVTRLTSVKNLCREPAAGDEIVGIAGAQQAAAGSGLLITLTGSDKTQTTGQECMFSGRFLYKSQPN